MNKLHAAMISMIDRHNHIKEYGDFSNSGVWSPFQSEKMSCCSNLDIEGNADAMGLNRKYGYKYIEGEVLKEHCKSIKHVANIYDVNAKELRLFRDEIFKAYSPSSRFPASLIINTKVRDFANDYLKAKQNAEDALKLINSDSSVKREVKSL